MGSDERMTVEGKIRAALGDDWRGTGDYAREARVPLGAAVEVLNRLRWAGDAAARSGPLGMLWRRGDDRADDGRLTSR